MKPTKEILGNTTYIGYPLFLLVAGSSRLVLSVVFHRSLHPMSLRHLKKHKFVGRLFLQTPFSLIWAQCFTSA